MKLSLLFLGSFIEVIDLLLLKKYGLVMLVIGGFCFCVKLFSPNEVPSEHILLQP
jgi:hypothetical protein